MKLQPLHQDLELMKGSPQRHSLNAQPTKAIPSNKEKSLYFQQIMKKI
jgi:hypothetical protein